ncbi:MAG: sulfatase-like hydrolase/transferase [Planctomycetota bacterium]|nr:sulfatase-like hydrolase/transferase [Planctomycetota bacterium]
MLQFPALAPLLAATTWLAACATAQAPEQAAPARPHSAPPHNVVVVVLDDVGIDLVGAYEVLFRERGRAPGTPAATPALDAFAREGLLFTHAWTVPTCSPSRARLLTGLHARSNGMGSVVKDAGDDGEANAGNAGLSLALPILPQALHGASPAYACAAVGKWHLADVAQLAEFPAHPLGRPVGSWFDSFSGSLFNLQAPPDTARNAGYANWLKTTIARDGTVKQEAKRVPPAENYPTSDTTADALALVRSLPEPYFLYVAYNAAHAPVHDVPGATEKPEGHPARLRAVVSELDRQVGQLLAALDFSDTTVVIVGDNGTESRGVLPPFDPAHSKGTLHEDGCRVPFVVRSPRLAPKLAGRACDALVGFEDVYATAVELAGAKLPPNAARDSRSLVPLLEGRAAQVREIHYTESFFPNFTPDPATGAPPPSFRARRHNQALTDGRFKLIRETVSTAAAPEVREQFFDLTHGGPPANDAPNAPRAPDWFEARDLLLAPLAADSDAARALARLRAELDSRYPSLAR